MPVLIHFVADWADAICGPHRSEVASAADRLGASVQECDIGVDFDMVRHYRVLNVPAVAIEGRPDSLVVGAFSAEELVERLSAK